MRLNSNIIVKVNFDQNKELVIGGSKITTARQYGDSWRHKNPSLCEVIEGNEYVREGQILLAQYNTFEFTSQYDLELTPEYGIYAIPFNKDVIIGWVDSTGDFYPMNDNILVKRVKQTAVLEIPSDQELPKLDIIICDQDAYGYHKGDTIFTVKYGNYEVFYVFNGQEKHYVKVNLEDIVGVIRI